MARNSGRGWCRGLGSGFYKARIGIDLNNIHDFFQLLCGVIELGTAVVESPQPSSGRLH